MKRGNSSAAALVIIILSLMIFMLFGSGMQEGFGKNLLTGSFVFDTTNINQKTNISLIFGGSLNFTILKSETNDTVRNVTNNSLIRAILFQGDNIILDKPYSLEFLKDKTVPIINFSDFGAYKVPNQTADITYTLPINIFGISYNAGGNYNLSFYFWYDEASMESLNRDATKIVAVFINDTTPPVDSRIPKLKKNIPNIDMRQVSVYNFSFPEYFEFNLSDPDTNFSIDGDELQIDYEFNDVNLVISFFASDEAEGKDVISFSVINLFGSATSNNVTIFYKAINASINTTIPNITIECAPNWQCGEWNKCANGKRTRTCSDANKCNVTANITASKPLETQKCTVIETAPQERKSSTASQETIERVPLQKLKNSASSGGTTIAGLSLWVFILIAVLLAVVLGGGAFYYFKFVRKDDDEDETEERKNTISTGGIVGESSFKKAGVNAVIVQQNKPAVHKAKPVNIDEIYKYLESAINSGADIEKAKANLIGAGWNKTDVERAANVITLKKYAAEKIGKGFDKQQLRDSLAAKGWKQDVLDDVFPK